MRQVDKTSESKKSHRTVSDAKPGKEFKKIYRELEKIYEQNKKHSDSVFSLCSKKNNKDDPDTILLHGEGTAPSMALTADTIEITAEAVSSQLVLIEEKMAKAAIILKEDKGIETTKIILNPPNPCSIFNHCEINLTKFDTSPFSFNIEFLGNDTALNVFAIHMGDLVDRFEQNNEGFLISRVSKGYIYREKQKRRAKSANGVK
ncbi:MAG: hypothetical protein ChlgKO_13170 [Chlamydiales bacterium]